VQIRRAIPKDLPHICELERQANTAAHWAEREYDALFAPEAARRIALVATGDDDDPPICGFVIAHCGVDEWEIENVVVARERQRRGVGGALVCKLLHEARLAGVTSVLLEVRESNRPARKLYEKMGFQEVGKRKNYYGNPPEDALLLKISISFS
jgi:[ribosomal protein S18]-alanine N-acetyltransferase